MPCIGQSSLGSSHSRSVSIRQFWKDHEEDGDNGERAMMGSTSCTNQASARKVGLDLILSEGKGLMYQVKLRVRRK